MKHEASPHSQTDEALALAAQIGDMRAFEELVLRYQSPLMRFLARRSPRSAAPAEDLVQDTFIKLYESLHQYQPQRPFKPWLFTIAWRTCQNSQRKRRLLASDVYVEQLADNRPDPADAAASVETHENLWSFARRSLSAEAFAIVCLFYIESLTINDIADVVGLSPGACKVTLHRARKTMLARLPAAARQSLCTGDVI